MEQKIRDIFNPLGFPLVGFVGLEAAELGQWIQPWLDLGYHAGMDWLTANLEIRANPLSIYPGACSAIVLGVPYKTKPPPGLESGGRLISSYAWGGDYHHFIKKQLKKGLQALNEQFEGFEGRAFVDSAPIPEKILATLGGLGFIGKNSLLVHPKYGSYLFLSSVISTLPLKTTGVMDVVGCGDCDLCIDHCPNTAITPNGMVNSNRCISYLTIEHKGEFSRSQSKAAQGHLFGCDLCQDCCPYNQQAPYQEDSPFAFDPKWEGATPSWFSELSTEQFEQLKIKSPLKRARLEGLKRNARAALKDE